MGRLDRLPSSGPGRARPRAAGGALALTDTEERVVSALLSELETWRAEHPGASALEERAAFSAARLWRLAGGRVIGGETVPANPALYRRLLEVVGDPAAEGGER